MAIRLRCPKCRQAFPWESGKALPDHCQLCQEFIGADPDRDATIITAPFIRSAKTDRTDKVYRDMEAGSEVRAKIGAEMVGAPVSEMSALKITNLNDHQREGDIGAIDRTIDVGQKFIGGGSEYMAGNASGAVVHNGQITNGIMPRAGASAVQGIRNAMGQGSWNVATVPK